MPSAGSWWLKLARAKEHLDAISAAVDVLHLDNPRAIRVEAEQEASGRWIYTAHHDLPIDPMLTVVLGEFLFDLRSALDHIAVANVPEVRRGRSQFPIFSEDIRRSVLNRQRWDDWTKGMPEAVVDIIRQA